MASSRLDAAATVIDFRDHTTKLRVRLPEGSAAAGTTSVRLVPAAWSR